MIRIKKPNIIFMMRKKSIGLFKKPDFKADALVLLRETFFVEQADSRSREVDELYRSLAELTKVLEEAKKSQNGK